MGVWVDDEGELEKIACAGPKSSKRDCELEYLNKMAIKTFFESYLETSYLRENVILEENHKANF